MFIQTNPNPAGNMTDDCVIRGISILTEKSWDDVYMDLLLKGFMMKGMPSSNVVWMKWLRDNGFKRHIIPDTCPDCYTIEQFCEDHPQGRYLLATGSHVVAVIDGNYYDTWQSGGEVPIYYFEKEN